ncbi:MAG: DUF1015 domain-containing protein [Thermotogae bacterium]|nr:DUF1015 domain-containing protein [Thermotogota bacterium]
MRAPEVFLSSEGFAVPYEELWAFLNASREVLHHLSLHHLGRTYLLMVQTFTLGGETYERRALLCMVDKREYRIYPHENTFPEGVRFYMELAREFPYQFAPVMLVGEDEYGVLKSARTDELLYEGVFYGVRTRLYTAEVEGELPREMVIADGHHRFAGYGEEIFVAFLDLNDPALKILPTHRGLRMEMAEMKARLRSASALARVLRGFTGEYLRRFPIVLKARNSRAIGLTFHPPEGPLGNVPTYLSDEVLLAGRSEYIVGYERYAREALRKLSGGDYDFVLFVRPTTPQQVMEVARAGLKMPRKSTDFFPKLVAGPMFVR